MEKKMYVMPKARIVNVYTVGDTMLENWSAPDATGGGNHPDAKAGTMMDIDQSAGSWDYKVFG